jgi:hypothetical protein
MRDTLAVDPRYWGRVAAMLVAHPRETYIRVRQRIEMHRFTAAPDVDYEPDPAWEEQLRRRLGPLGVHDEGWRRVVAALERDLSDFPHGHDADTAFGRSIWQIARSSGAQTIVETGVARAVTSRFALEALEANGRGHLWSVDLPPVLTGFHSSVGAAVPDHLRHRWTYIRGSSRARLEQLLRDVGPIDMFVQDSLGTPPTVKFELSLAWSQLKPGGWLLVNGVNRGVGLREFLAAERPALEPIIAPSAAKSAYRTGHPIHGQFALIEKTDAERRAPEPERSP